MRTMILIAAAAIALTGCTEEDTRDTGQQPARVSNRSALFPSVGRVTDKEHGIVCYVTTRDAISCVPMQNGEG